MNEMYDRLVEHFETMNNGFPRTESGVELKLLERIFSPEDAEVALHLNTKPETAEEVAERLNRTAGEIESLLDNMAKKGQITSFKKDGKKVFAMVPFTGMFDLQLNHLDEEMAALFKEYKKVTTRVSGATGPASTLVIPVNQAIEARHEVLRYEDMYALMDEAESFAVRDCICRVQLGLEGDPCSYPKEVCLGFSKDEEAYEFSHNMGRVITREEAKAILKKTAEAGLVYCSYNVKHGHNWVCSCCICCCELLKSIKNHTAPYLLAGSNFVASIDGETCSACGTCAEERCMMEAITEEDGEYRVEKERCIGCGVCTVTCPTGSISLARRPEPEQVIPPENLKAWSRERAANAEGGS